MKMWRRFLCESVLPLENSGNDIFLLFYCLFENTIRLDISQFIAVDLRLIIVISCLFVVKYILIPRLF